MKESKGNREYMIFTQREKKNRPSERGRVDGEVGKQQQKEEEISQNRVNMCIIYIIAFHACISLTKRNKKKKKEKTSAHRERSTNIIEKSA
jgi:hypothetical protein